MIDQCPIGVNAQDRDDKLELYALGRLPASEVEEVEGHLLICAFCRERLDEAAAFAFSAREALKERHRHSSFWPNVSWAPSFGGWRLGVALTSAVAALVLAVGMYRVWRGDPAPVAALYMTWARNAAIPSVAPSRELEIHFADIHKSSRVIVSTSLGAVAWSGLAMPEANGVGARVRASLPPGRYLARLYAANGTLIHEYEFHIAR